MPPKHLAGFALLVFCASVPLAAADYDGSKILKVSKGIVVFQKDGKSRRLPAAASLKILDGEGNVQDAVTAVGRFLLPDNIVDVKTEKDAKSGKEEVVEIRFVSGTVADLPAAPAEGDLRPDPQFKGNIIGGDGYSADPYWQNYIRTAQVGDYIEYRLRGEGDKPTGRTETVEVGQGYVITSKVYLVVGTREEHREKHRLPTPEEARGKNFTIRPGPTEEIEVAGKKLACQVKSNVYRCADVPFDGVVKSTGYTLLDFGRGESSAAAAANVEPESNPPTTVDPSGDASASPPKVVEEPRVWTSADGRFKIEATMSHVIGELVYLKRKDNGEKIKVSLNQLSEEDRAYIRKRKTAPAP